MKNYDSKNAASICPICQKTYHGVPAISRLDNRTSICHECGTRQALQSLGICDEEQKKIIQIIHEHSPQDTD